MYGTSWGLYRIAFRAWWHAWRKDDFKRAAPSRGHLRQSFIYRIFGRIQVGFACVGREVANDLGDFGHDLRRQDHRRFVQQQQSDSSTPSSRKGWSPT